MFSRQKMLVKARNYPSKTKNGVRFWPGFSWKFMKSKDWWEVGMEDFWLHSKRGGTWPCFLRDLFMHPFFHDVHAVFPIPFGFCHQLFLKPSNLPSWQLTYPLPKTLLKMIFLCLRWDKLVPWRVEYFGFPIGDLKHFPLSDFVFPSGTADIAGWKMDPWRCISYCKWGCSQPAMFSLRENTWDFNIEFPALFLSGAEEVQCWRNMLPNVYPPTPPKNEHPGGRKSQKLHQPEVFQIWFRGLWYGWSPERHHDAIIKQKVDPYSPKWILLRRRIAKQDC